MKGTESFVDACGDICIGDFILFTEKVFPKGSLLSKGSPIGERQIHAQVMNESYGEKKQQHTFTLRVIESTGTHPLEAERTYLRKGRNIHRNGCLRALWENEDLRNRALSEKHVRGEAARRKRFERRTGISSDTFLFSY